ncbi:hypothetical protein [Paenibacillus sp. FSL R7-0026]|uniref:hypothetical protein n=1 Tax=Paenibacillus sp. FSL R7-0026 TaxID=2921668 RepID=UPI0030F4D720
MNSPSPAAPVIKKLASALLNKKGEFTVPEFKKYIEDSGYTFTKGQIAGALTTLVEDPQYFSPSRGVYALHEPQNQAKSISTTQNSPSPRITVTIRINNVLEQALVDLRQIANVNLLDVDKTYLDEIEQLKNVIQQIEELKLK